MSGNYWRMVFIQPSPPDSGRCVLLYGELDEIVGPLTAELAEAWMSQFQVASASESSNFTDEVGSERVVPADR